MVMTGFRLVISLIHKNFCRQGDINIEHLIFPHDTGHRVKDHTMIQNEMLNEKTTQETWFGIQMRSRAATRKVMFSKYCE
jgi:hypothetical protein